MNKISELQITDNYLKFCLINHKDPDFLSSYIMDNIKLNKYHFGIILHSCQLPNLSMPIYYADRTEYYALKIFIQYSIYYFIFLDIDKLASGLLKKSDFNIWLRQNMEYSDNYDYLYIISNVTPFYYLQNDGTNEYIKEFLDILSYNMCPNSYYLSTDNDYYANLTMIHFNDKPRPDYRSKYVHTIKYVLAGKMSIEKSKPKIFLSSEDYLCQNYRKKLEKINDKSGYVEFIFRGNIGEISWVSPGKKLMTKLITKQIIKMIEMKNEYSLKSIGNLINYAKINGYIDINWQVKHKHIEKTDLLRNTLNKNFLKHINDILDEFSKIIKN